MSQDHEPKPQSSFSTRSQTASGLPSAASLPQPENRARRFWRQARRRLAWGLFVGVIAFFLANIIASALLMRELVSVMQREEPLRLSELAPAPIPEPQNAATVYLQAANALVLTKAEEDSLHNNKGDLSYADVLAKNGTAIKLARRAAALPDCRFAVDYEASNPATILFPHLVKIRKMADVMRAQALQEAQTGQADTALDDVTVLFRMSEHLAPEPTLISGLTAIAIERTGYKTLAQTLDKVSLFPEQARKFALRLPQTDWTATLHHDLTAERCFGLWMFQRVSDPLEARQLIYGPSEPKSNVLRKGLSALWSPAWKMDEVQYLRVLNRQSEALLKPGTPMISEYELENELVDKLPWYAIGSRLVLPALPRVRRKRDDMLVYRGMARIALACNACRTTQGQYPDTLNEAETVWGSVLPRDLFTEQSFVYKKEGDQMRLYSVGPNHKDDGGKKADTTGSNGGNGSAADDIVW